MSKDVQPKTLSGTQVEQLKSRIADEIAAIQEQLFKKAGEYILRGHSWMYSTKTAALN